VRREYLVAKSEEKSSCEPPRPSLPSYYLTQAKEYIESMGGDADAAIRASGLSQQAIEMVDTQIEYSQFEALAKLAVSISPEGEAGLRIGEQLGITTHGMLGYALLASGTVAEAFLLFKEFINTRTPLFHVQEEMAHDALHINLVEPFALADLKIPVTEVITVSLYKIICQLSMNKAIISELHFPYPKPSYVEAYQELFDCELHFGAALARIVVPKSKLQVKLLMANPKSLAQARAMCQQELKKIQVADSWDYKVRKKLLEKAGYFPSLAEVSGALFLTPRTLQRYLKAENTTFQQVLEGVRHTLALEYLKHSSLSVQEIAYLLGYHDIANFRRAFRRWESQPPSTYRQRVSGGNK